MCDPFPRSLSIGDAPLAALTAERWRRSAAGSLKGRQRPLAFLRRTPAHARPQEQSAAVIVQRLARSSSNPFLAAERLWQQMIVFGAIWFVIVVTVIWLYARRRPNRMPNRHPALPTAPRVPEWPVWAFVAILAVLIWAVCRSGNCERAVFDYRVLKCACLFRATASRA